jgi:hypothetical protein
MPAKFARILANAVKQPLFVPADKAAADFVKSVLNAAAYGPAGMSIGEVVGNLDAVNFHDLEEVVTLEALGVKGIQGQQTLPLWFPEYGAGKPVFMVAHEKMKLGVPLFLAVDRNA